MKGLNLYLVGSLENQFDVHLGLASGMTEQKSCDYTGKIKREGGNHAVTKAMYFTQEKNKFESLHIIVTLIALFMHQIAHWRVIRYYELVVLFSLFYVPNFLPKQ